MVVRYNKLLKMLINKKMSIAQLAKRAGVSGNIMIKIKKNQYISLDMVEKICTTLSCGVDDILKFTSEGEKTVETVVKDDVL